MLSLDPPTVIDEEDLYDDLSAGSSTHSTTLTAVRDTVLEAYRTYATDALNSPTTVIKGKATGSALQSNYTRLSGRRLRGRLLSRSGGLCCLCACPGASDLDHYLPKELIPEFSALTKNLVPACSRCNQKKRDVINDQAGRRVFVHPYFEDLPKGERFLRARLDFVDGVASAVFDVVATPSMKASTFAALRAQFDRLELADLYASKAIEFFDESVGNYEEILDRCGSAGLEWQLQSQARSLERAHGLNHWKTALLMAAASCEEFFAGAAVPVQDC